MAIYQGNEKVAENVTIVNGATIDDSSKSNLSTWSSEKIIKSAFINDVVSGSENPDPNTTSLSQIRTKHDNCPTNDTWYIVNTIITDKQEKEETNNYLEKQQIAIRCSDSVIFTRLHGYQGEWSSWSQIPVIDDKSVASDKVWTSQKINDTIPSKLSQLIDDSYSHAGIGTAKDIIDYKYPSDGAIRISSDPGLNVCEGIAVYQDSDGESNYTINKAPLNVVQNYLGLGTPTIELIAGTEDSMKSSGVYVIKYGKCVNIVIGKNYRWKQLSSTSSYRSVAVTIPKKYAPSSIYPVLTFSVSIVNGLDDYDSYNTYIAIERKSDGTASMTLNTMVSGIDSGYGVAVYGGSTTYFTD